VLVVAAPGAKRGGQLLADELELVDLSVKQVSGPRERAESEQAEGEHRAVVWLDDQQGAVIWLKDEPEGSPAHEVERTATPELLALRTAEVLRGRLLPAEGSEPSGWGGGSPGTATDPPLPIRRFALAGGPGVIASSYAQPLPSFSLQFVYRPWPIVSVGAFGIGSLTQNGWLVDPVQFSTSQFSFGAAFGVRWLDPPAARFHSDLVLRSAVRRLQVRTEGGGPMGKVNANLWGPTFDFGVGVSWELAPWFDLGLESCFIVGLPLGRSIFKDDGKEPPADAPIIAATASTDPDFQVVTTFLASASF